MGSNFLRGVGWLGLLSVVWVLSAGCAESRAPINRVQAGALDKSFFVGTSLSDPSDDPEFYMGHRIIDEPYGVGQGFWMYQSMGSLARIKWEIQETLLIGRLTYERIQNSDHHGSRATNSGQIVAEFAIQSHFDIKNDYNTQTGEQLNVVVENTTDRPWYQRQFFRVDWSTNLVTDAYDFDFLALGAAIDGLQYEPGSYYVQDPNDPNAPVFAPDQGYFDVTTKISAKPQVVSTPYGNVPSCLLFGSYPAVTCDPAEVTLRLSFKKVVDDDYEPEDWNGNKMNAFGWFSVDRYGYDRDYGVLDANWHRFATKYNIWQRSHVDGTQCAVDSWRDASGNVQNYRVDANNDFVFDPVSGLPIPDPSGRPFTKSAVGLSVHRDADHEGTEDECQFTDGAGNVVNPGSRCDEFKNKCDIPLYERKTKTTPIYIGPTSAPDLFQTTAQALNEWNIAVKRAVQLGKITEANRAGVDVGQANFISSEDDLVTDQQNGLTVPDIFVLCHNPVASGDSPACGPAGLGVRLGDLRYHVVNLIQDPQLPSAWGIETDFDDPLTGEKVQGSINEWTYVLDVRSQDIEDLIRWVNGEITNDQIANGHYLGQWLAGAQLGAKQYIPAVLSQAEIQSRLGSIDMSLGQMNGLSGAAARPVFKSGPQNSAGARAVQALGANLPLPLARQMAAQNLAQTLGPSLDTSFEATRQNLLGTQWEAQLVTPNVLQWAGFDPQQPVAGNPTTIAQASPLQTLNPMLRRWGDRTLSTALALKNMCLVDDTAEPDSLVGLANQAQKLFPKPNTTDPNYATEVYQRDQALHQWIRQQLHLSVIAHEMGHSMGLRHNFTGSFDALNYRTEYWQIRSRNGQEHYCGYPGPLDATTPHANGADCVGPRWVDPVTAQETNDFVWKWGSTTVMDYPGDYTQDMNDIGNYDKAAMRFGYADIVDVEKNASYRESGGVAQGNRMGIDYVQTLDGFGGILSHPIGGNHYSTYNDKYALLGTCSPRPGWQGDPNDPLAQRCTGPALDYVAERDMMTVDQFSSAVTAVRPDLVANFGVDSGYPIYRQNHPEYKGRVRHPYMFGSDEFADVGNIPVFRFDAGADSYEQMQFFTTTYENRYIFNNFRRQNVLFNTDAVVSRLESRYFDKVQAITKSLGLGVELSPATATSDPGQLMPMALASADGFAMFVRALMRPEPGPYTVTQAGNPATGGPANTWGGTQLFGTGPFQVALGDGEGRFIENNYDYTQGYWWSQYQTQVGSYYDKILAPAYLTEAYNQFISNQEEDYIDGRYKNLSYASLYPNQIRRLFANLMATQSATPAINGGAGAQIFSFAPYTIPAADGTATVQYLPWDKYDPTDATTTSLAYPSGAVLLDPDVGWEQQYPALINLFWFGPTSLTMDLVDQMRIFSPGDAASVSLAPSQQVAYRDPLTGLEYVARNYGTEAVNAAIGFEVAKTVGARMIQHANFLASIAYQVTQPPDPVTGELTYVVDANGNAIANPGQNAQNAATMLKGYASNIDTVRQLTRFFGYGPLGH